MTIGAYIGLKRNVPSESYGFDPLTPFPQHCRVAQVISGSRPGDRYRHHGLARVVQSGREQNVVNRNKLLPGIRPQSYRRFFGT